MKENSYSAKYSSFTSILQETEISETAARKVYSPTTRSGLTLRDSMLKLPLHTLQVTVLASTPAEFQTVELTSTILVPQWKLLTGKRRREERNSPHGIGSDSNPGPLCP